MILIIHFGGQYTDLIRRAVNEENVYAQILEPHQVPDIPPSNIVGVILSGGPMSVHPAALDCGRKILSWDLPVLGICFGHQLLAVLGGGTVTSQYSHEYGRAQFELRRGSSLLVQRFPSSPKLQVWMSHGDTVTALPDDGEWTVLGHTERVPYAAIANDGRRLYGVQFHPEVTQTECGPHIFKNFLGVICHAPKDFSVADLVEVARAQIAEHMPADGHVLVACSLGVDSSTDALLCAQVLGQDRVHSVLVNNGLLRKEDLELAEPARTLLPGFVIEDAEERFLAALEGVADPEEKRRRIGGLFWTVFGEVSARLVTRYPIVAFSQGTLAPDRIESGTDSAGSDVIKTHHNMVPRPLDFPFQPLEPFARLYKDQVRKIGARIGVPEWLLSRHPFPGPGLAIRMAGPVTRERLEVVRTCDDIFIRALRKAGWYHAVSQALAVLEASQPVAVLGNKRARRWSVQLRAFVTRDFMTATVADLPNSFKDEVSAEITNRVPEVKNVSFCHTSKPPGTIEWE